MSIEAHAGNTLVIYLSLDTSGFPQFAGAATIEQMRGYYQRTISMPRKDFYFRSVTSGMKGWEVTAWSLGFPIWAACLGFLVPSFIAVQGPTRAFFRRRKRRKLGLCLNCGYDLRGSKDACPECGTYFESSGV